MIIAVIPQLHHSVTVFPFYLPYGTLPFIRLLEHISWFCAAIRRHMYTLLLFTYTDYKTIFIPVMVFSAVAAPVCSLNHFFHALLWTWLHLLQCNVSNQYKTFREDIINRPWRPIPSRRITLTEAFYLRLVLLPVCLCLSGIHGWGVVLTSAGLTGTMVLYDEVGLAGHWVGKNLCNVFGYFTFEIGTAKIMARTPELDGIAWQAMAFSACVIMTTIQAQDFSDVVGDAKIGRITFPIYAPSFSRIFTFFAMIFWSTILSTHWSLGFFWRAFFCAFGAMVGWRYYALRKTSQDSRSYLLFNVWLFMAHLLPSQARWSVLSA